MVLGGILGVVCERRTSESFAVIWGRYTYYLLLMGVAYWGCFGDISKNVRGYERYSVFSIPPIESGVHYNPNG